MKPSLLVERQLPEFVIQSYPAFVEFLKAYYQWLEQTHPSNLQDTVDIDQTSDQFLLYFRKQLDTYGVTSSLPNAFLLQRIRQLYQSKGTDAGVSFLFKVLYQLEAQVVRPWDSVFKTSNGQWYEDVVIYVEGEKADLEVISGSPVLIEHASGRVVRTYAREVTERPNGVFEVFIKRYPIDKRFGSARDKLVTVRSAREDVTKRLPILTSIAYVQVDQKGKGFVPGQAFAVNTNSGRGSIIKVKSVDSQGGITAVSIINFGVGYAETFTIPLTPQKALTKFELISYIELNNTLYPSDDITKTNLEEGLLVQHDYTTVDGSPTNFYFTDPTYVGDQVGVITESGGSTQSSQNDVAVIRCEVGEKCIYPGYYLTVDENLGNPTIIQDSNYYQINSYVTVVDKLLDQYKQILRDLMHPSGSKQFATYLLTTATQYNVVAESSLNIVLKDDVLRSLAEIIDEFARVVQYNRKFDDVNTTISRFDRVVEFNRSVEEQTTTSSIFNRAADYNRFFDLPVPGSVDGPFTSSRVSTSIDLAKDVGKFLGHSATTGSLIATAVEYNRQLDDASTATSFYTLNPIKGIETNILTSDTLTPVLEYTRTFTDSALISDLTNIQNLPNTFIFNARPSDENILMVDKYTESSISVEMSGGLYMDPLYVDQSTQYWEFEYLENERKFTN